MIAYMLVYCTLAIVVATAVYLGSLATGSSESTAQANAVNLLLGLLLGGGAGVGIAELRRRRILP